MTPTNSTMVGASSNRPPQLIGRERELARIEGALSPGKLIWVSGPTGIGKTALVRTVVRRASGSGSVLYVAEARTLASVSRELTVAYALRRSVTASNSRRRRTARNRREEREPWPPSDLRAIVFDHLDEPGPRLNELIDVWREHCAVVLVARSRETLRRLHRQLYDCEIVEVGRLSEVDCRSLISALTARLRLAPLNECDAADLARGSEGVAGLIVRALLAARRHAGLSASRLLSEARILQIAGERDAVIRARLRDGRRRVSQDPR